MQVKKQQLEPDIELTMEQQSGSKSGNKYIKGIYFHPDCLTHMQST